MLRHVQTKHIFRGKQHEIRHNRLPRLLLQLSSHLALGTEWVMQNEKLHYIREQKHEIYSILLLMIETFLDILTQLHAAHSIASTFIAWKHTRHLFSIQFRLTDKMILPLSHI